MRDKRNSSLPESGGGFRVPPPRLRADRPSAARRCSVNAVKRMRPGPGVLFAVLCLAVVPGAAGADDPLLRELEQRSPFLPPNYNESRPAPRVERKPPETPLDRLYRFTGVIEMGGRQRFALHDLRENRGFWTGKGEAGAAIRVERFDAGSSRVYVTVDGRSGWLPLQKRDLAVTEAPPPPPPNPGTQAKPPEAATPQNPEAAQSRVPVRRRVIVRQPD